MKNNKGFTLIELLAVIIVLAVVMVLATRTILPQMSNARIDAFEISANAMLKSATDAKDYYNLGKIKLNSDTTKSCKINNTLCFTIEEIIELGLNEGDKDIYQGKVIIENYNGEKPTYTLYLQKGAEFSIVGSKEENYENSEDIVEGGFDSDKLAEYTTCTCNA